MTAAAVNLAYCQHHRKGGDHDDGRLPGQAHAEWLEQAVCWWHRATGLPVLVSITGFPGWPEVVVGPGYYERDVLWRVWARPWVRFVTMNDNPGHQVGAAWCIRLGLEAASKLGHEYLVHAAEDVLPEPGAVESMLCLLESGSDYVGWPWGADDVEQNSQFFACRVQALVGTFDPPAVAGTKCLEKYLAERLAGKRVSHEAGRYRHTHDFAEYQRWLAS